MKVAIYIRTSKIDQHPENQRLELEKYAKAMGYKYDIYEEQESTRKTRPIKENVMQMLREKKYQALMIWKLDRWGRSLQELIGNLQELTDKGIKIICMKDNIDYTSSSGRLFANILASFAEYERAIIRERTMLGLERAKSQGKKLGRPKGSSDKKRRRLSGYHDRWKGKK